MDPDEGISIVELALAARNHGMPLEALRHDLTPAGLHYLLIHYDIPDVDPATWTLTLDGAVRSPRSYTLADLTGRPTVTRPVTLECAGNGRARIRPRPVSQPWLLEAVGNAAWTGVHLRDLLDEAGVEPGAVEVLFTGLDRGVEGGVEQSYQRSLSLGEARREEVLLAHAMNGEPLPPQHGSPLRLVVPGWYGMASVKWLSRITVLREPFRGYQHERAYRMWSAHEDDPGIPVTRILPRSLLRPPGIPEFLSRRRRLPAGAVELHGRAWSGFGPVERVEVSADGGATWEDAQVEAPPAAHSWQAWRFRWQAATGSHVLCSRATDSTGRAQPPDPEWNRGGYQVNAVQRVEVEVG